MGTSPDTLRYYERIGLLPPPARSPAGYRLYTEDSIERVRFIKGAQRFGLRLDAIAELLGIRDQGMCACGHTRELLERRLRELDAEVTELTRLRGDIEKMISGPTAEGAGCTAELMQVEAGRTKTNGKAHVPAGHVTDKSENERTLKS